MTTTDANLIERIYEASVVPELWPDILDELGSVAASQGGLLFTVRDRVLNWTSSDCLQDAFSTYVDGGYFQRCARKVCLFTKAHSAFMGENDYWTPEEYDANEVYRDFFRPRGLGWSAGTGLQMPTGDNIVFSIERAFDEGPIERPYVDRLNTLRPHLARSALISSRLGLKQATGAKDVLDQLGLPTLLLDADRRCIEANDAMADLSDQVHYGASNRVTLYDNQANEALKSAMDSLSEETKEAVRSFPLRSHEDRALLVAHLLPIRRTANDLFSNSYALLVFTPVTTKKAPPADLIKSLFDLTAAEAKVARALAQGSSVDEIAEKGSVALTTVRTQLRRVMEKTGCSRQAEVVALMANLSLES